MTTDEMRAVIDGAGLSLCLSEIKFATPCLLRAADEFDNCEEYERAMAVRRALKALDEATEGLS